MLLAYTAAMIPQTITFPTSIFRFLSFKSNCQLSCQLIHSMPIGHKKSNEW